VALESQVPFETARDLAARGHQIRFLFGVFGRCQAIGYDAQNDIYYGASDSRADGCAAGY